MTRASGWGLLRRAVHGRNVTAFRQTEDGVTFSLVRKPHRSSDFTVRVNVARDEAGVDHAKVSVMPDWYAEAPRPTEIWGRWGRQETGPLSIPRAEMTELQVAQAQDAVAILDRTYAEVTEAAEPSSKPYEMSAFDHLFDNEDPEDQEVRDIIAADRAEKDRLQHH